jgi:hypothetical protein
MEKKAADAHEEQHDKGRDPHLVMTISQAGSDTPQGEVDEKEVGEGVYEFRDIMGSVVVLHHQHASDDENRLTEPLRTNSVSMSQDSSSRVV